MGRVYSLRFDAQSVSAPNDLMTLVGVSSAMTRIISISVGQTTAAGNAAAEILPISIRRYATSGTGGTTRFRNPFNRGHGTAQVTGATNHTTLGGTPTVLYEEDWHVELPFQVTPIMWDEHLWIPPAGILAVTLPTAPSVALLMYGTIVFEDFN